MSWCSRAVAMLIMLLFLTAVTIAAAPVDFEEEMTANVLGTHGEVIDGGSPWDGLDAATLRRILLQIDADDRMPYAPRALRAWSPLESRGWGSGGGPRALDNRAVRQWRADKRQVRFRQCYFNPISCFRK